MNPALLVALTLGQWSYGDADRPTPQPMPAETPAPSRDADPFPRRILPATWKPDGRYRDPEPESESEKEQPTITPNATAAQDAHGRTFYSLIDVRGFTHWGYDWARLWNEVQAVNAGVDPARQYAARAYVQPTYGQPATYGSGTGGSGGRPQPWVVRAGVYGRPLAVALPALGGAGAVCTT